MQIEVIGNCLATEENIESLRKILNRFFLTDFSVKIGKNKITFEER